MLSHLKSARKVLTGVFGKKKVEEKWEKFTWWPLFATLKLLQWRKTFLNKFQGGLFPICNVTYSPAQMEYWRAQLGCISNLDPGWYMTHIGPTHSTYNLDCWPHISIKFNRHTHTHTRVWLANWRMYWNVNGMVTSITLESGCWSS